MIAKTAFLACVLAASFVSANEFQELKVEITMLCPQSEEFDDLKKVMNSRHYQSEEYEEWVQNFEVNMQKLVELVKSGKVGNPGFNIGIFNAKAETQE
jgi:ribosomal protein L16 Arg81 hydroxylase